MKLLITLFVFIMVRAEAQDFEGTIKWSVKTETADPTVEKMESKITMKMKNGNASLMIIGGPMAGMEALYIKNQTYSIDRAKKTFSVPLSISDAMGGESPKPVITKTSETKKILDYNCIKYISKVTAFSLTATTHYWIAADLKSIDFNIISKMTGDEDSPPEIIKEGFPLMIETTTATSDGKTTTVQGKSMMQVLSIKKELLNATDFSIPSDFKEAKQD